MFKTFFQASLVALFVFGATTAGRAFSSVEHGAAAQTTVFEIDDYSFDIEQ